MTRTYITSVIILTIFVIGCSPNDTDQAQPDYIASIDEIAQLPTPKLCSMAIKLAEKGISTPFNTVNFPAYYRNVKPYRSAAMTELQHRIELLQKPRYEECKQTRRKKIAWYMNDKKIHPIIRSIVGPPELDCYRRVQPNTVCPGLYYGKALDAAFFNAYFRGRVYAQRNDHEEQRDIAKDKNEF